MLIFEISTWSKIMIDYDRGYFLFRRGKKRSDSRSYREAF